MTDDQYTDLKIAEVVARECLDEAFIWIRGRDWLGHNGVVWQSVSDVHVTGAIGKYVRTRVNQAAANLKVDQDGAGAELRGWLKYENAGSLAAIVRLSRGFVEHRAEELDTNRDWLNCPNGVINLKTGELMAHDLLDLFAKVAGVDYIKGATHPDWTKALEAIPKGALDWYQVRLGQAITGHMTPDDLLIVGQGGGRNGKSTINVTTAKAAHRRFGWVSRPAAKIILSRWLRGLRKPRAMRRWSSMMPLIASVPPLLARPVVK